MLVADALSKMAAVSTIFPLISSTGLEFWVNFTKDDYLNMALLSHKHHPFIFNFPYGKHLSFLAGY